MRLWSKFVLRFPKSIVLITIAVTVVMAVFVPQARISNEIKEFLPSDNPAKAFYSEMTKYFGSDSIMIIGLFLPEGLDSTVLEPEIVDAVARMSEQIEDIRFVDFVGDEFDDYLPGWFLWPKNRSDLNALRESLPECTEDAWQAQGCQRLADHDDLIALLEAGDVSCSGDERSQGLCFDARNEFVPALIAGNCESCSQEQIAKGLCARTNTVEHVLNIFTLKSVEGRTEEREDGSLETVVEVADMIPDWPEDEGERKEILAQVEHDLFDWDVYVGSIIARYKRATALVVEMPTGMEVEQKSEIYRRVMEIVEKEKPYGIELAVAGPPVITLMLGEYMNRDLRVMIPLVVLVILITLLISFRRLGGVVLPMLTVTVSVIWTLGFMAVIDRPMTMITSSIPVILMAIGTAYTIHMIHHIYELVAEGMDQREAVAKTLEEVGFAVVMTGATTVVGFMANTTSKVVLVRDFGFFLSLGVATALVLSITFIPALLVLVPVKAKRLGGGGRNGRFGRMLVYITRLSYRFRKPVVVMLFLGLPIFVFLATQIISDNDFITFFKEKSLILQDDKRLNQAFGGTSVVEFVFEGGPDTFNQPENLAAIDDMLHHIEVLHDQDPEKYPEPGKHLSAIEILKRFHQVMNNGDKEYYRLPPSEGAVMDYFFSIGEDELDSSIDVEEFARFRVVHQFKEGSTRKFWQLRNALFDYYDSEMVGKYDWCGPGAPEFSTADRVHIFYNPNSLDSGRSGSFVISGPSFLQTESNRMIVTGQLVSLLACIMLVFILCMVIFKSALGGLYAIVPIIETVGFNFGLMGLTVILARMGTGIHVIPLEIGTALVAVGAIGMGVDYAIHYINRFRLEINSGKSLEEALDTTAVTSGTAISINAISLVLGWLVLIFSQFNPLMRMGILTALSMFVAATATLICYPAMFGTFMPKFVSKK